LLLLPLVLLLPLRVAILDGTVIPRAAAAIRRVSPLAELARGETYRPPT
jgi:hypothetical protein